MGLADQLVARTLELCAIPSPIGHEQRIADHVEQWATRVFPAQHLRRVSHSFLLGDLADPRPTVALIGHLDTVPAHPTDQPPRREGDRLIALGSSDMKGGLAVMMTLAETLPRGELPFNLLFLLYEREEGPFLESGLGPILERYSELRRVRLGIAMEPTDNVVQVGCVGSIHATLRLHGKSAHSARPWQGENAIHRAGPLLERLAQRGRVEVNCGGYVFYEVASITTAKGGRARNVVPDLFELNLNYRFAPGKSLAQAQSDLEQLVGPGCEIEITDRAPSGRVCTDNPLFVHLLKTTGLPAASKQAWTDVARFSEMGIDAVNFGPGETAQAHQAHESASCHSLVMAYEKLRDFLSKPA